MFAYVKGTEGSGEMAVETSLLTFVAGLVPHSTAKANLGKASADIRRALQRIEDDPSAALTLADLARESGVSRFQLLRAFARELGMTPHAYIMQRRVALARRLLLEGMTLTEVAVSCGFYDQSHLNRCFVRQFGVTPRRYRERVR
jgi:AraC-like DNA-binding protein